MRDRVKAFSIIIIDKLLLWLYFVNSFNGLHHQLELVTNLLVWTQDWSGLTIAISCFDLTNFAVQTVQAVYDMAIGLSHARGLDAAV